MLGMLALVGATSTVHAQALSVAPSGRATTEVSLTPTETTTAGAKPLIVRIDYGQPHLRGRQLHTGDLVPYDQPWRLGANAATTLMTDVDLLIGNRRVPKGTYVLRALPSRAGWKLLVEEHEGQSPTAPGQNEKPADVVATIDLKQSTLQAPLESFAMWLIPSTAPGSAHGELRFAWGTTMLSTDWTTK
jgi:hypothetical protein